LTTFALGGAMTVFAWNVFRQNRRRDAARVELLSSLAFPDRARVDRNGPDESFRLDQFEADEFPLERPPAATALFDEPEASGAPSRRAIVLAALCLMTASFAGSYGWFGGTKPAVPAQDPRVELVALDHDITASEVLVKGRIRNPVGGVLLHDVVAVVNVKDAMGGTLTTVRAPVTRPVLDAGESWDFSATAANVTNVGGFSVSFDARERKSILQIDRRQTEASSRSE
jgi:hypothetical protein